MTESLKWFKSSYSGSEGGACVEVAAHARVSRAPPSLSTLPHGPRSRRSPPHGTYRTSSPICREDLRVCYPELDCRGGRRTRAVTALPYASSVGA
ncbi:MULTISPECIES: DUF397 domain-containing protein [unclassified Streptomyces]|uniref:DUF397 domain-containing protein n=1 Tax=unclassified Streptomyces TaxID=2593676 RepID=UPI002E29A36B|nr:DUF397 domain-containing protein [Streptomyces sp. NBC_00223]